MPLSCYTCREEITFDDKILSKTGKKIPLWPDKMWTHEHDDNGKARKGKPTIYNRYEESLSNEANPTTTSRVEGSISGSFPSTTKTEGGSTQGGFALDTKRLLTVVSELEKKIDKLSNIVSMALYNHDKLKDYIRELVIMDNARFENQVGLLYGALQDKIKENTIKTGTQVMKEQQENNNDMINHSKRADEYQNFMNESKRNTKLIDESKERIPDDNDAIYPHDDYYDDETEQNKGVITED